LRHHRDIAQAILVIQSNWGAPQNLTDVRKKLFGESWQRFSEHDVLLLNASKHRSVSWPVFLFVRPASFLN